MRIGWFAAVCVMATSSATLAQPRVTPPGDRACLEGYVDKYLDAMLANTADSKLFARDVKFTENGVRLPLGSEGLWFGMSGKGSGKGHYRIEDGQIRRVEAVFHRAPYGIPSGWSTFEQAMESIESVR